MRPQGQVRISARGFSTIAISPVCVRNDLRSLV
jgi:hypothetical protein